jgi:uncharacterized membrane protein
MNLQIVVAGTEVVSALAVTFTLIAMIKHPAEHQVIEGSGGRFPGGSHHGPAMESHAVGSAISKATTN